jgi:signal transduction histidine kinase
VGVAAPLTVVAVVRGDEPRDVLVAWVLVASGLLVGSSRRSARLSGWLLLLTGWTWLSGAVIHRGPLAHLLLTWPSGRPGTRWVVGGIALAYGDAIAESIVPSSGLTLGYAALLAATAVARLGATSGMARRGRTAGAMAALAVAGAVVLSRLLVVAVGPSAEVGAAAAYAALVGGIGVALALDVRAGRWTEGTVTGLVVELGGTDRPSLAGRLGRVLGDPSLVVALARDRALVDESGRRVQIDQLPVDRAALAILDGNEVLGYVVHDRAVLDDVKVADAVVAAMRVAVANQTLREEVDAAAEAIAASQRRVESAADDQRRRMERQVAAGPIARLERARLHLEHARAGVVPHSPVTPALDLIAQVEAATSELTTFALGLYPASLSSGGLRSAVRAVAAATPLTVIVDIPPVRLPEAIEAGAYFVCAEAIANAVKHARATRVVVEARTASGSLRMTISDDGVGSADAEGSGLRGLRDRVQLLGGTLTVTSPSGGGTRVAAVVPIETPGSRPVPPVTSRPE